MTLDQIIDWVIPSWALLGVLVGVYVVATLILAVLPSPSDDRRIRSIVIHLLTLAYLLTWMILPGIFTVAATVMVVFDLGGSTALTVTSAVFTVAAFVVGAKIAQASTVSTAQLS